MTQDSTEERHRKHVAVMDDKRKIEELEAKLKISEEIGRAFEEDAGQLRAKLDKAVAALRYVVSAKGLTDPTECGYEAIKHARIALAEIKGE